VIAPVVTPTVQVNVLGLEAVSVIFGPAPLHVVEVAELVTTGAGLTVTVIINGVPGHDPLVAVGVTMYSTVPVPALLGLVNT
jgi:hypothetical protein